MVQLFKKNCLRLYVKVKFGRYNAVSGSDNGDYDVNRMQHNIPYCTQAAYVKPGGGIMLEVQLVRPIQLTGIANGVSKFQNSRI